MLTVILDAAMMLRLAVYACLLSCVMPELDVKSGGVDKTLSIRVEDDVVLSSSLGQRRMKYDPNRFFDASSHRHHQNSLQQISSEELEWSKTLFLTGRGRVDLWSWGEWDRIRRTSMNQNLPSSWVSRAGCCELTYQMNLNRDLWPFRSGYGAARYPCCVGDLEWYRDDTKGGSWHMRPRAPPKSLVESLGGDDEADLNIEHVFHGRTIIVAGDSMARQVAVAIMCSVNEPIISIERPKSGWARGSDLLATYRRFSVVRTAEHGRTPLSLTTRIVRDSPRPVELVLVSGGSQSLGHHWLGGRCANRSLADDIKVPSDSACAEEFRRVANASIQRALQAVDYNPDVIHLVSTTPQHYPTISGDFHARRRDYGDAAALEGGLKHRRSSPLSAYGRSTTSEIDGCAPLAMPASMYDHWRNVALRDTARFWRINFYDSFEMFRGFWDAHIERAVRYYSPRGGNQTEDIPSSPRISKDCVHFCQHKRVWHRLIVHLAQRVVLNKAIANLSASVNPPVTFPGISTRLTVF